MAFLEVTLYNPCPQDNILPLQSHDWIGDWLEPDNFDFLSFLFFSQAAKIILKEAK